MLSNSRLTTNTSASTSSSASRFHQLPILSGRKDQLPAHAQAAAMPGGNKIVCSGKLPFAALNQYDIHSLL
ncbi:MAG TPA: hypothetical protein VII97_02380 [Anaerolineales bacterium]